VCGASQMRTATYTVASRSSGARSLDDIGLGIITRVQLC
jgi:hypothetical protein